MSKRPWPFFHMQHIIAATITRLKDWARSDYWRITPIACLLIFCCIAITGILNYNTYQNSVQDVRPNSVQQKAEHVRTVNITEKPIARSTNLDGTLQSPIAKKPSNNKSAGKTDEEKEKSAPIVRSKPDQPVWPLAGKVLVNMDWNFHPVYKDWRYHSGIDIAAAKDEQIKAALGGQVTRIYTDSKTGLTIVIKSGEYDFIYGSLSEALVVPQTHVRQAQPIARAGQFPAEPYYHLHLAVKRNNQYVDPQKILQ